MKRTALFIAALAISLTACDSESPDDSQDRFAEAELEADAAEELEASADAHHRVKRGKHSPAAEICEQVACSEAQLQQVQAAFARPEHAEGGECPERPDTAEADATLAKAFAGDSFAASDLQAWRAELPERPQRGGDHLDKMSELHAILTAEQRSRLAVKIAAGEAFGRRHDRKRGPGHRGDAAGEEAQGRHAEHLARRVEQFCEPLQCTEAQQGDLSEIFERKHADRGDKSDRREALARAFEAESFDAEAVEAMFNGDRDADSKDAVVAEVHGVLTAEQRATLAEQIAEQGPRALMGKHHKRGGKHGRHGKRRGHKRGHKGGHKGAPQFG